MEIKHHLAEDTIDQKDIDSLVEWLKDGPRLTKGQLTVDFEKQWSSWIGKDSSVFCNSGSSANLLMYYALLLSGKLKNKKIIVPATGWVTSIAPAIQFGFEPIMCGSDPDTFGLNLEHLESLIKKHDPAVVFLVQVLGVPHKMDSILALKKKYGFILLEDTCASIGSTYRGRRTGTFGDVSTFSFYFGHQMSTIEGGMVSTNDPEINDLLLMSRSHGWSKDVSDKNHQALVTKYNIDDFHSPFVFYIPGLNLRSTDLNAFLGMNQIKKLDWMVERRNENHQRYLKLLGEKFMVQKPEDPEAILSSIHFCVIAESTDQRKTIVKALVANGIESRIFSASNLGRHPFWHERFGVFSCPVADRLYECGFFLPNHPSLKLEDVEFISKVVLEASCMQKSS